MSEERKGNRINTVIERAIMAEALNEVFGINISADQIVDVPSDYSFSEFIAKMGDRHANKESEEVKAPNSIARDMESAKLALEAKQGQVDTLYKEEKAVKARLEALNDKLAFKSRTINEEVSKYHVQEKAKIDEAIKETWSKAQEHIDAYVKKSKDMADLTVNNTIEKLNATVRKVNAKEADIAHRDRELSKREKAFESKGCNCHNKEVKQDLVPDAVTKSLREIEEQL